MRAKHFGVLLVLSLVLSGSLRAQSPGVWLKRNPVTQPWNPAVHSAAAVFEARRQRVVLFGGIVANTQTGTSDLWEWTGADWNKLVAPTGPGPRCFHPACSFWPLPGMIVHGGVSGTSVLADCWEWNGVTWKQNTPTGPGSRWLHALAYDVGRMRTVLYGGSATYASGSTRSDTWEWDGVQWANQMPTRAPGARAGHAMAFDLASNRTVLFGGATDWSGSAAVVLNDTWEWDGTNWTNRNPIASPPPRHYHSMTYDVARGAVVVFGGRATINGAALSDAWEWSSAVNTWRQISIVGASINARDFAAFAHDVARARDVTVGGYASGTRYGDTWELLPAVPAASAQAYGAGCIGSAGIPALVAVGVPKLGNASFALQLTNARTSASAALLMAEGQDNLAIGGGCALLVASPIFTLGTVTSGTGTASWPLPVANNAAWLGIELFTQHVVADPSGAFSGLAAFSNGQALRIGN